MNKRGFTLVEMMLALSILGVVAMMMYGSLMSGEQAWHETDGHIRANEELRQGASRIIQELRKSSDAKTTVTDSSGGGPDILQFAIPVIYAEEDPYVTEDIYGDTIVANWGVPLNWGCNMPSCMHEDYSLAIYFVANGSLWRSVINSSSGAVVDTAVMAKNITDMQIVDNGRSMTITLTAQVSTNEQRTVTKNRTFTVYLRNEG